MRDKAYQTGVIPKTLPKVADTNIHLALQESMRFRLETKIRATAHYGHSLREPKKIGATSYQITDCEDWKAAKEIKRGGEPVTQGHPNGEAMANPITVTYQVKLIDGRWKVNSARFGRNKPCNA
ncbi:hypothetical protein DDE18_15645 [Nocardioides gansuensis]|uniref:ARC6 IMS domain-containing protein n=1 Tax=Nocardioides gansuensis TaxID=2138300 RepID=A0A2T8F8U9_9ACTN|nr:hypothetical protein DDE18_15645 [Nocardioides gansuensis]